MLSNFSILDEKSSLKINTVCIACQIKNDVCYSPKYCRKVKDGLKKEAISSYGRITDAVSSAVLVEFSQFLRPIIIIQKSCFFIVHIIPKYIIAF